MVSSGKAGARIRMPAGLFLPPVSLSVLAVLPRFLLCFLMGSRCFQIHSATALKQAAIGSQ